MHRGQGSFLSHKTSVAKAEAAMIPLKNGLLSQKEITKKISEGAGVKMLFKAFSADRNTKNPALVDEIHPRQI